MGGFMLFVLLAAVLLLCTASSTRTFAKKHPRLEPFYTPAQIDRYNQRFVWLIAGPVAVILAGVIPLVVAGSLFESRGLGLSLLLLDRGPVFAFIGRLRRGADLGGHPKV